MTIAWNLENEYREMSRDEQEENAKELARILRGESSHDEPSEAAREQLEFLCALLDHPISLYI